MKHISLNRKGGDTMANDKDVQILATFAALLPRLSDRQKENLLFYGEGMAAVKRRELEEQKSPGESQGAGA